MRSRQWGNAVPGDLFEIQVFDTLTVNVNFVLAGETLDALGNASFGAMPFIDEWGDNRNSRSGHGPERPFQLTHGIGFAADQPTGCNAPAELDIAIPTVPRMWPIFPRPQVASAPCPERALVEEPVVAFAPVSEDGTGLQSAATGRRYSHSSDIPQGQKT
jgi:hypothetical protein